MNKYFKSFLGAKQRADVEVITENVVIRGIEFTLFRAVFEDGRIRYYLSDNTEETVRFEKSISDAIFNMEWYLIYKEEVDEKFGKGFDVFEASEKQMKEFGEWNRNYNDRMSKAREEAIKQGR